MSEERDSKSLIRLEEQMVAEKSSRRTRDEQFLKRIGSLEEGCKELEEDIEALENKVEATAKKSEEMRNRTEGQVSLIKALVPIIGVILSLLISMGVYILHDSRVQVEKELRKDIEKLEESMYQRTLPKKVDQ